MNLSSSPANFTVPTLGDVEVDHQSNRFLKWFADLTITDEAEVFRAMLRDQARRAGEEGPLDADMIAGLDGDTLQDGASAFLAAAENELRPRWIRDPVPSNPNRVRERTPAEAEDLALRPDENELQRLVRVLTLAAEDARLGHGYHTAKFTGQMAKAAQVGLTPSVLAQAQSLTSLGQLNKMIADLPGNQLKGLLNQTHGVGAIANRPVLAGFRSDLLPAYLRAGAIADLRREEGVLRTLGLLTASQKGMLGLAQGGVYNQLLVGAARTSATAAALASVPKPADWLKSVNSVLGLGLTAQILAAAAAAQTMPLDYPAQLAAYMRPGWQATAAIGVARDDARPAARVVLTSYDDEPDPQGELLATAVAMAHQLDEAPETLFARILALFDPAWSRLVTLSFGADEEVRRAALFTMATLIIAFAQLHVGNEALKVAQAGPTAAQLEALAHEAEAVVREEHEKTRQAERDEARRLRQVTKPCLARIAPEADATAMLTIYPDELIRVIDESGDWVKVEVFQYHSESTVFGWVPRRFIAHRGS